MTNRKAASPPDSRFTKSINLEQDLACADSLSGYVITTGVRRALLRVASPTPAGFLNRAITLTGPYGTGKSAFALFCSHLLAPAWSQFHRQARRLLHDADPNAEKQVFTSRDDSPSLLPVVVTGSREPLTTAIVRGLLQSFSSVKGQRVDKYLTVLRKHVRRASLGHHLDSRALCAVLAESVTFAGRGKQPFQGISLVVDELGKLLEYATANPGDADAYVLQAVAEFAVRCERPFLLMGVLHQDFSAYVDRLAASERAEWEKVRGRFEDCAFEEPADEVLRLVAHARTLANQEQSGNRHTKPESAGKRRSNGFKTLILSAAKLDLAPSTVAEKEFVELLQACRPLHPLVAILVGPLFRRLAQNERSVFSFLDSVEPNGLRDFLSKQSHDSDEIYRTDHLYDYLVTSLGPALYSHTFAKRWAEIDSVLARLPDASELDVFLVKTIGLLSAVGQWRHLRATTEILAFAASGLETAAFVAGRLEHLRRASALVYRRYNASYSLWEGSDLDIDDLLTSATSRLPGTVSAASLAEKHLHARPFVARRHSFLTGTLRFFTVRFATPQSMSEIADEPFGNADGRVIVVLPEHSEGVRTALQVVISSEWTKRPQVLVAVATDPAMLAAALREYALLLDVQQHTPELAGDQAARRELRARIGAARQRTDDALAAILTPRIARQSRCKWFHRGKSCDISSQRELNEYLSGVCGRVFSQTPRIRNELINRRDLSSAAAAARRNLIEAMIDHGTKEDLGIVGTPPEKSMYLSLLKATGIHRRSRDQFCFSTPSKESDGGIQAAWQIIHEFFSSSDCGPKQVAELFTMLQSPPFGMKAGPLPILLCAALLALDSEVALYEEGSFIPQLTVAVFERLLRTPSRFSVQRWKVTGIRMAVFDRLTQLLLPDNELPAKPANQILAVVRPLCRFASSLNEYGRSTSKLSPGARSIRDALLRATKPDQLLFIDLPAACGLPPFESAKSKDNAVVDQFITTLRSSLDELRMCYKRLLHETSVLIEQAFSLNGGTRTIRATLVERARRVQPWIADPKLKSFVGRLIDDHLDDDAWIESIASLTAQRPPAVWKDEDPTRFEVALAGMVRHFQHVEALAYAGHDVAGEDESIRIGITTRSTAEFERVIRVPASERVSLEHMRVSLLAALGPSATNGHTEIAVAALIQVAQQLLNK